MPYKSSEKERARCRAYYHRNKGRSRRSTEASRLLRMYGISKEQYEEMLSRQGGVCALCEQPCSSGRKLAVDHIETKNGPLVRGLLCGNCNRGIGQLQDNPDLIRKAAHYIEKGGVTND